MSKLKIGKRVGVLFFNIYENKDELREGTIIARTQKPYRWVVRFDDGGLHITNEDCLFLVYDKRAFKEANEKIYDE